MQNIISMLFFSLVLCIFCNFNICLCEENETRSSELEVDFVPIGKDAIPLKPLPSSSPPSENLAVVPRRREEKKTEVWKDGIKYTEIVRQTPLGGVQVSHVEGGMDQAQPSLLPRPLANLGQMMNQFRGNMRPPTDDYRISNDYQPYYPHNPEGFEPIYDGPGPPPPRLEGLLGRLGLLTGRVLDGVAEFLFRH